MTGLSQRLRYARTPPGHFRARTSSPSFITMLFNSIILQDILPKEEGLKRLDFGQCAIRSDGVL